MPTYHDRRLKPCKTCGTKPVLEHWSSGGPMFAVRCDNPDRPDSCDLAFNFSKCRNPEESIRRWNEWQTMTQTERMKQIQVLRDGRSDEIDERLRRGER